MEVTIVKTEELPSTTNGWGFGGSTDKVRYTLSNGDEWVAGTAHYRHAPSESWLQKVTVEHGRSGSTANAIDVKCPKSDGARRKKILSYYKSK